MNEKPGLALVRSIADALGLVDHDYEQHHARISRYPHSICLDDGSGLQIWLKSAKDVQYGLSRGWHEITDARTSASRLAPPA